MSVEASAPLAADPSDTVARYRDAVERLDLDAVVATLAPDVELHSPISARACLQGPAMIRDVLEPVYASIEDIRVVDEVATSDGQRRVLYLRGHISGGEPIEESVWMRIDEHGLIAELTVFIRPLGALTALMAAIGPSLAARHGRVRGWIAVAATRPLAVITRRGDPLALRLTRTPRR